MERLREQKSLSGHDAYCHVCWNAVYLLWVDREAPDNQHCPFGEHTATTCPDAIAAHKNKAIIAQLRRDGHLPALKDPSHG